MHEHEYNDENIHMIVIDAGAITQKLNIVVADVCSCSRLNTASLIEYRKNVTVLFIVYTITLPFLLILLPFAEKMQPKRGSLLAR